MGKKVVALLMVVFILLNASFVIADTGESMMGSETSRYVDVVYASSHLTFSGSSGLCTTKITTKESSSVNKMVVTVYYYKSDGTSIGSNTVTSSSTGHIFIGSTSRTAYSHGTYYAEARVKLYHNSQLIESFILVTNNATY